MIALSLDTDWVVKWRLLLEKYGPEIMYIAAITTTIANAISRLDKDPTCTIIVEVMKCLDENGYIHGKHMH